MPDEKFKLPGSSYEEICKIIKAYATFSKPASNQEVSGVAGVHHTVVSRNNGFLLGIGVIEGGNKKALSEKGRQLGAALAHGVDEDTAQLWGDIVTENEFLSKMVAAVRIRKGMDISSLQGHIAYSSGARKTGVSMAGAAAVLDILNVAGLVREQDGRIVPGEHALKPFLPEGVKVTIHETPPVGAAAEGMPHNSKISMHIEVRIDAKPSEMADLGKKLRALLHELSQSGGE